MQAFRVAPSGEINAAEYFHDGQLDFSAFADISEKMLVKIK